MPYNKGKLQRWPMGCPHHQLQALAGGTDHRVLIRADGTVQAILVRGFPADYCTTCRTILTDLSWELAVQEALERRIARGEPRAFVVEFADLGITQPGVLAA